VGHNVKIEPRSTRRTRRKKSDQPSIFPSPAGRRACPVLDTEWRDCDRLDRSRTVIAGPEGEPYSCPSSCTSCASWFSLLPFRPGSRWITTFCSALGALLRTMRDRLRLGEADVFQVLRSEFVAGRKVRCPGIGET